ncbi:hypothetical protein TRAPUB_5513 [Trametes pubescens]|uniref:BTB domain-containing protein n=1 Tax=Trametes pubescens TaxID=154538 RepID=A0A1M2V8C9_TRAPU|nr:hypothetical protein TRAPUB_5513 [Trametes pubescens]
MQDDAEDFNRLLSYIYKPSEYLLRPSHSDTPVELRGAVKLAGKYLLDNASADIIRRVTMDWPTTLDEWDILENERRGRRRMADSHLRHPRPRARWALCEKDNLMRRIKGRQALEDYIHDVTYELKDGSMLETAPSCRPWWIDNPELVAQAVEPDRVESPCLDYLRMLCALVWDKQSKNDPLAALLDLEIGNYPPELDKTCPEGLCQGCHRDFGRWVFRERRHLWKIIPAFFDL